MFTSFDLIRHFEKGFTEDYDEYVKALFDRRQMDDKQNMVYETIRLNDNRMVLRCYLTIEHPYDLVFERKYQNIDSSLENVKIKKNSRKQASSKHLVVFENELVGPEEICLVRDSFEEWLSKHKVEMKGWKIADADNFMQGNSFFNQADPEAETALKRVVNEEDLDGEGKEGFKAIDNVFKAEETNSETDLAAIYEEIDNFNLRQHASYVKNIRSVLDFRHKEILPNWQRKLNSNQKKQLQTTSYSGKISKLAFGYDIKEFFEVDYRHEAKLEEEIELNRMKQNRQQLLREHRVKERKSHLNPILFYSSQFKQGESEFEQVFG